MNNVWNWAIFNENPITSATTIGILPYIHTIVMKTSSRLKLSNVIRHTPYATQSWAIPKKKNKNTTPQIFSTNTAKSSIFHSDNKSCHIDSPTRHKHTPALLLLHLLLLLSQFPWSMALFESNHTRIHLPLKTIHSKYPAIQ